MLVLGMFQAEHVCRLSGHDASLFLEIEEESVD
jgi:hypothetical protein